MELEINNLQQLLNILENLQNSKNIQVNLKSSKFFRGQSDYSWNLIPGVYREDLFYE